MHRNLSPPCSNWRRSKWQATKTKLLWCTRWIWPSWALGTRTSEVDAAAVPVAVSAPSAPSFESGSCSEGPSWKGGEGQAAKLVTCNDLQQSYTACKPVQIILRFKTALLLPPKAPTSQRLHRSKSRPRRRLLLQLLRCRQRGQLATR